MASDAKDGKFLMGSDDITALDIHCAPMWEIMYLYMEKGPYAEDIKYII